MSYYRVLYGQELVDDLTDIWIAADPIGNRILEELTFAVDRTLKTAPAQLGEAVSEDGLEREWRTAAFNGTVRVRFEVFPATEEVEVSLVVLIPPPE